MITIEFSNKEIIEELKSINAIIESNYSGYLKKYSKELNSKEYGDKDVLGVGEYRIKGNKVIICFQKFVITDELSNLWITHIVVTEDNGAFFTAENEWGNFCFYHIESHAIDRMLERAGLTLKDFFVNEFVKEADATIHLKKYKLGYYKTTNIMTVGRCFFIVENYNNKIVVKTTFDYDWLFPNQKKLYRDSKEGAYKFADKMYKKNAEWIKGMGYKNTNDAVRAMCA